MPEELTDIQRNILEYIADCKLRRGIPPTLAEIAVYFGYKNRSTVQQHLGALEKKGLIKRNPRLSRGIELTGGETSYFFRKVLGEVAAGNPMTIYSDAMDTVALPSVVSMPQESFLLRVRGDSLKDAYIFDGDLIIVNPKMLPPKDGQIVVAIIDDAAVVKKFFLKDGAIELHSENPAYKPIVIPRHSRPVRIAGVVVGMYRSMRQD